MSGVMYRFEAFPGYEKEPNRADLNETLKVLYDAGALDAHQWGYNPGDTYLNKLPISPIIIGSFVLRDESHAYVVTKAIRKVLENLGTIVSFEIKWYQEEFALYQWCFYQEDLDE